MALLHSIILLAFNLAFTTAGFFYTESGACGAVRCPDANFVRFYGCNDKGECDFQLQPWLFMLIAFVVLSILCSLLCSFLRCICCGLCDNRRR